MKANDTVGLAGAATGSSRLPLYAMRGVTNLNETAAGPTGMQQFFEEAFHPVTDRSASPPLITEEMVRRMTAAAARNGMEFVKPA